MKPIHPITQVALCMLCPTLGATTALPSLAGALAQAAYAGFYLAMMSSQTGRSKRQRREFSRR